MEAREQACAAACEVARNGVCLQEVGETKQDAVLDLELMQSDGRSEVLAL